MKKKIALTGASGFLGSHIINCINSKKSYEYIDLGRNFEESLFKLKNGDILIHAASAHRDPIPENVYVNNINMINKIIETFKRNKSIINIIFISSVQEVLDNPYGRSKKDGRLILEDYCKNNNALFVSHSLPNLFGPNAKPNSTSFVATFCYNIQNNIICNYNDNVINLCYVKDAVEKILALQWHEVNFKTTPISVEQVYFLLKSFKYNIDGCKKIGPLTSFEEKLLNTFLSYKSYQLP